MPGQGLEKGPGRALLCEAMTWVWAALIAVGVVMIAVALWPSRGGGTPDSGEDSGEDSATPSREGNAATSYPGGATPGGDDDADRGAGR